MEYMGTLKDGAFDLAIVDPPYGIDINMNIGRRKGKPKKYVQKMWDKKPPQEYFDELFRVSKNQIIWGGNYFGLPASRCWLAWDKGNTFRSRSWAEFELAWTSFDASSRLLRRDPNACGDNAGRIHPTQKPVDLYKWALQHFAKPCDRILDTHLGSASIALACHDMGFDLVGCEIDKAYYDAAVERLDRHRRQMTMKLDEDSKQKPDNYTEGVLDVN
jgi:site-specific DNA-methyltransferase (adenine-specific)